MTAFDDLMAFQRETEALSSVAGRLHWDQETMMPRGAAPQRGEELAAMEAVLHARRTDPRVGEWLAPRRRPTRWRRPSSATSAATTRAT
jgi:carboxypeptidase Taq